MFQLNDKMKTLVERFLSQPTSKDLEAIWSLSGIHNWIPTAFLDGCKCYPDDRPTHPGVCRRRKCPLLERFANVLGQDSTSGICGLTHIRRALSNDLDSRSRIPVKKMAKYILAFQQVIPMLDAAREIYGKTSKQRKSKTG